MRKIHTLIFSLTIFLTMISTNSFGQYAMPEETSEHEGTWLQWPHHYTYGMFYRNSLDNTWVEMTQALISSEKVHIIAYNLTEKNRIITLLNNASIPLTNIDFFIHENDDTWIRDNGPIFVYDNSNDLVILDWGFNGWGNDAPFAKCDIIPASIATDINLPIVDLNVMVLEGGAIEIDGNGTLMATRSSVTHTSRNPNLTETQIENYLTDNLGITNFIWLDGLYGTEITDMHIDGFVKFANDTTIVTMNNTDLLYWQLSQTDINTVYNSTNINNQLYSKIYLPLTQNNVITEYGNPLGYKGSYCNYYIANTVVIVPNYNDPNDSVANAIIQNLYPNRSVIGIDVRNLYENGGMIHCVTQQQPKDLNALSINIIENVERIKVNIYPNPTKDYLTIELDLKLNTNIGIEIYNADGKKVKTIKQREYKEGNNIIEISTSNLSNGFYTLNLLLNNKVVTSKKVIIE